MFGQGYLSTLLQKTLKQEPATQFTIGRVIDTNDPQQMGRVRVQCSAWGDDPSNTIGSIPFAVAVSPLAGVTVTGTRGANDDDVNGPVAYGMWNVPKLGSYVVVGCFDGARNKRFYIGGLHPQFMTHTLPHGRFLWHEPKEGKPEGPLDTYERPIEPLYRNITQQFTTQHSTTPVPGSENLKPRENLEWRTRGVDRQTSAITNDQIKSVYDGPGSEKSDVSPGNPSFTTVDEENGNKLEVDGPGYAKSHIAPDYKYETTGENYDSHVYSWTTPGFHSYSMDDRKDNSRIRIRTAAGHQILLDDTNERIYINTAGGESWIEIDQVGNIDIYASKNISTHAGGDINFFADKTIRMQAKEGIHLQTEGQFRAHSKDDFNIRTEKKLRSHSADETRIESDKDMHIRATGSVMYILADSDLHLKSVGDMYIAQNGSLDINTTGSGAWTTGERMDHMSGQNMYFTGGPDIHLNGPQAQAAFPADDSEQAREYWAYLTSRVPEHEPWARVFMKKTGSEGCDNNGPNNESGALPHSNVHTPEYSYTDELVGKGSQERGETYQRGKYWHR